MKTYASPPERKFRKRDSDPRTTEELVREAQAGDQDAKTLAISRIRGLVLMIARRLARNPSHVEDLLQDGMIVVLEQFDRYDPARGMSFSSFVGMTVTHRLLRMRFEHNVVRIPPVTNQMPAWLKRKAAIAAACTSIDAPLNNRKRNDEPKHLSDILQASDNGPDPDFLGDELAESPSELVRIALAELTERERIAVIGYMAGRTMMDIGLELGITYQRVQQLQEAGFQRARETLRKYVKRRRAQCQSQAG